jgi:hypothetical protein
VKTPPKGGGRINAAKTTCPQGHPYSHVNKRGQRCCRTCIQDQKQAFLRRHRVH